MVLGGAGSLLEVQLGEGRLLRADGDLIRFGFGLELGTKGIKLGKSESSS